MEFITTPRVSEDLKQEFAVRARPIVLVIGAGVSKSVGLPLWSDLRERIVKELLASIPPGEPRESDRLRLQSAAREEDLWIAFDDMKKAAGDPEFRRAIRQELDYNVKSSGLYGDLWNLPLAGVINLNIDEAAILTYPKNNPPLRQYVGAEVEGLTRLLGRDNRPFLWALHGRIDQPSGWIMTRSELERRLNNVSVSRTLSDIFDRCTVVFLGVGASDEAVSAVLQELADVGGTFERHFWITDTDAPESHRWAKQYGVRIIGYEKGGHSRLSELLRSYASAAPAIPAPRPEFKEFSTQASLPADPVQAERLDEEELRRALNTRAKAIVEEFGLAEEYDGFVAKYDRAIYRAWYLPAKINDYRFMGYVLQDDGRAGAFGRVFPALDDEGRLVAVKLLREEQRSNIEMLAAFRRGVEAMKILTRHELPGMVRYIESSELPAMVVMNYLQGSTLAEMLKDQRVTTWEEALWIGEQIAHTIERAHDLKERVLHRDIRPGNIMVSSPYERADWELTVLDFDLSTFVRADDRTFLADKSTGLTNYLAPEQMTSGKSTEARRALVDSYGVGMTLYALCSGRDPLLYSMEQFKVEVGQAAGSFSHSKWKSLPVRYARLVRSCIEQEQSLRPSMTYIRRELSILREAHLDPGAVSDESLLMDELVARCDSLAEKGVEFDGDTVVVKLVSGITFRVTASARRTIGITIEWVADASIKFNERTGVADKFIAELRKSGWRDVSGQGGPGTLFAKATCPTSELQDRLDYLAQGLNAAIGSIPKY